MHAWRVEPMWIALALGAGALSTSADDCTPGPEDSPILYDLCAEDATMVVEEPGDPPDWAVVGTVQNEIYGIRAAFIDHLRFWEWRIARHLFDVTPWPPTGGVFEATAFGLVNGIEVQLGKLKFDGGALQGEAAIVADYSAVGSSTQRVEVYADGTLVSVLDGWSGSIIAGDPSPQPSVLGKLGGPTACFYCRYDDYVTFYFGNFGSAVGNEIRVLAENASVPEFSYSAVGLTGFGSLPGFAVSTHISGELAAGCPEDLNQDGRIDLADLATLLSSFGLQGGPGDGDVNGDGIIDLADLSLLLSSFGLSCDE